MAGEEGPTTCSQSWGWDNRLSSTNGEHGNAAALTWALGSTGGHWTAVGCPGKYLGGGAAGEGSQSSAPFTTGSTQQSSSHRFPSHPFALLKDAGGWSPPGSQPRARAAFRDQQRRDKQKM